jgi:hypothetical protein
MIEDGKNTMTKGKNSQSKKAESISEKVIGLWAQIVEELGNNNRYNEIILETLRGCITFAS